jgi:glycosyltransferase involved in cell wall biosynthesis
VGEVPRERLRALMQGAKAFLFAAEEDFGIVPLEAQACGRPVVALARGGAPEALIPGETGLLVDDPSAAAFADAVQRALGTPFDAAAIRRHAERFGRARFGDQIEAIVRAC